MDPLMNRLGGGVEKDMERAEAVNAFIASAFSGMTCLHESQAPLTTGKLLEWGGSG